MKRALCVALLGGLALSFSASNSLATDWHVSVWGKRRIFTEHIEKMAEILKERTNGEFTLHISYGTLSSARENLNSISNGGVEMAQICAGYHADKNPAITVLELPFLGVRTLYEQYAVANAVYNHPATIQDMARWNAKILMPSPAPQYNLVGKGEPRDTLEKMKAMRVRATDGIAKAFMAIGADPVFRTASKTYEALDTGVVDTVAFAPHAHLFYKTIDLANWWTENLNPGSASCPVVINIAAYESLTIEHRVALDAAVKPSLRHYMAIYRQLMKRWDGILKQKNVIRVQISEQEIAKFKKVAGEPIHAQWIKEMTALGLPAQELYDLVGLTLEKVRLEQQDLVSK